MKKTAFLLVIAALFMVQCVKKPETGKQNESDYITHDKGDEIDFDEMKHEIDASRQMDMDIFFAISVLHKKFISGFSGQTASMTEDQQKAFYSEKKKEFFKTIKYSESDYNNFMKNHAAEMNDYINDHKAIGEYLISIN